MNVANVGFLAVSVEYDESASGKEDMKGVYNERYGKCASSTGDNAGISWSTDDVDALSNVDNDV